MSEQKIHTRNGTSKAGPQRAPLVPCALNPRDHGHHPEDEKCTWCEDTTSPGTWRWFEDLGWSMRH